MVSPRLVESPPERPLLTDNEWFRLYVIPLEKELQRWLRANYSLAGDAEDITQDAYIRLLRERSRRPVRHLRTLLFLLARQVALNEIAKKRRWTAVENTFNRAEGIFDDRGNPADLLMRSQEQAILEEAIQALPEGQRLALELTRMEGLTYQEAAEQLGIAEKTVDAQIQNAMKRCKAHCRNWTVQPT